MSISVTIWANGRDKAIEKLWIAYGTEHIIIDESPIFNKSEQLIGFRFVLEKK